ncbi:MAG: Ni/Fe hydrogenase subunit alpha [Thiotrichales bacterium]
MTERHIDIHVPALTRVEGEGALHLKVQAGKIEQLQLSIFEPPRYFEKFLENRAYTEVLDTVARICGICPIAYQMSAVQAIEQAFGVQVSPWVEAMRRVFYCGEWLQSHSLHIHLLAAPDFLGFNSVIEMSAEYPAEVRRGLALQGLGNDLIALFGGRSVHPVGACVGGFHHAPDEAEVSKMVARLEAAIPEAEALLAWTARLTMPEDDQDFISVAMRHEQEYPFHRGRLISSEGLDIKADNYEAHFKESHAPHSTALYSHLHGEPYLVGPLARLNLNLDRLPNPVAASLETALKGTGIEFPSRNMFHSMVARAVEMLVAIHAALDELRAYGRQESAAARFEPCAGTGFGLSEAPRGILWHRYDFDAEGRVKTARIVPPTSQNQARIETDLHRSLLRLGLDQPDDKLRLHSEMVIRNYDPCISCATHFLDLKIERDA